MSMLLPRPSLCVDTCTAAELLSSSQHAWATSAKQCANITCLHCRSWQYQVYTGRHEAAVHRGRRCQCGNPRVRQAGFCQFSRSCRSIVRTQVCRCRYGAAVTLQRLHSQLLSLSMAVLVQKCNLHTACPTYTAMLCWLDAWTDEQPV